MGKKKGGYFLARGSDTCVFTPPVACADGTPAPANTVSRIVQEKEGEIENQQVVKDAIEAASKKIENDENAKKWLGGRPLSSYFNFASLVCVPSFKPEDLVTRTGDPQPCSFPIATGPNDQLRNLVTPRQDADLRQLHQPLFLTYRELRKLFHAALYLNNEGVVHTDLHASNIAWMGDHLVMHDWGRSLSGAETLKEHLIKLGLGSEKGQLALFHKRKHMQYTGVALILYSNEIVEKNDFERFIKITDIASLLGTIQTLQGTDMTIIKNVETFLVEPLQTLLDSPASPEEVSQKSHEIVETFFDVVQPYLNLIGRKHHPAPMPVPQIPPPVGILHPAPRPVRAPTPIKSINLDLDIPNIYASPPKIQRVVQGPPQIKRSRRSGGKRARKTRRSHTRKGRV